MPKSLWVSCNSVKSVKRQFSNVALYFIPVKFKWESKKESFSILFLFFFILLHPALSLSLSLSPLFLCICKSFSSGYKSYDLHLFLWKFSQSEIDCNLGVCMCVASRFWEESRSDTNLHPLFHSALYLLHTRLSYSFCLFFFLPSLSLPLFILSSPFMWS